MGSIPLPALDIKPPQQPDMMGDVSKLMAMRSMMNQQQEQQQRIQEQQQTIADQQATTTAMKAINPLDPKYKNDSDGYYADLSKSVLDNGGSANAATGIQQHGLTIKKTVSDIAKQDAETGSKKIETFISIHKAIGDALEGIENVPDEQLHDKAVATVQDLAKNGIMDPAMAQGAIAQIQQTSDPKALRAQIDVFAKSVMGAKAAAEQAKTEAETHKDTEQAGEASAAADLKRDESNYYATHGGAPGVSAEIQQQNSWLARPENKGKDAADFLAWKAKQSPMGLVMGNMLGPGGEGSALDQAAQRYLQSGEMPQGLARSPGSITAILKRAAEMDPNANIAANKVNLAANKASLQKLQTSFDQVSAFESTAGKNLDLFLDKLNKIPDLGVKFANTPLRLIDEKMIGSDNYQAMKAAQQTAAAEAAKVLSSANASGVLSDSQKKEAEDILSGNLSYSAAKQVVGTLKQDFANRHQSYDSQIKDIQRRIGIVAPKPATTAAPGAPGAFSWDTMPEHK